MYKFVGVNAPIGVPAEDMTDQDFARVQAEYEKGFPGVAPGVLERSGLWQHVDESKSTRAGAAGEKEGK